jgi:hypothetical protein
MNHQLHGLKQRQHTGAAPSCIATAESEPAPVSELQAANDTGKRLNGMHQRTQGSGICCGQEVLGHDHARTAHFLKAAYKMPTATCARKGYNELTKPRRSAQVRQ